MSELNSLEGFQDRFWYWQGKSGIRYIHSIYAPDACPPLPGAIFLTVQKLTSGKRVVVEVGRFCENWDYLEGLVDDHKVGFSNVDEIHVHLLAKSDDNADEVLKDLEAGVGPRPIFNGFHEGPIPGFAETSVFQPNLFGDQSSCSGQRVLARV